MKKLALATFLAATGCTDSDNNPKDSGPVSETDSSIDTDTHTDLDTDQTEETDSYPAGPVCPPTFRDLGLGLDLIEIIGVETLNPSGPTESYWNSHAIPLPTAGGDLDVAMFGLRHPDCEGSTPIVNGTGALTGCFPAVSGYQGLFFSATGNSETHESLVFLKGVMEGRRPVTSVFAKDLVDPNYVKLEDILNPELTYGGISFRKLDHGYDAVALRKDPNTIGTFDLCFIDFDKTLQEGNEFCPENNVIKAEEPPYYFTTFGPQEAPYVGIMRGVTVSPGEGLEEFVKILPGVDPEHPFALEVLTDYIPDTALFVKQNSMERPYYLGKVAPMGFWAHWNHNPITARSYFDGPSTLNPLGDLPLNTQLAPGLGVTVASTSLFNPSFSVGDLINGPLFGPVDLSVMTGLSGPVMNGSYAAGPDGDKETYGRVWQGNNVLRIIKLNGKWHVSSSAVIPVGDDGGTALQALNQIDGDPLDHNPIPLDGFGLNVGYEAPLDGSCSNERIQAQTQRPPMQGQMDFNPLTVSAGKYYTEAQLQGYDPNNPNDIDSFWLPERPLMNPRTLYALPSGTFAVSTAVNLPNRQRTGPDPDRQAPPVLVQWKSLGENTPHHNVWTVTYRNPNIYDWEVVPVHFICEGTDVNLNAVVNTAGTQISVTGLPYSSFIVADPACNPSTAQEQYAAVTPVAL